MATGTDWGKIESGLAGLRAYDADPFEVERIRARCVAALGARRYGEVSRRSNIDTWRRRLEPIAAFSLSTVYLAAAFVSSIALFR